MQWKVKNSEKSDPKNYEIKHPELEYALYLIYFKLCVNWGFLIKLGKDKLYVNAITVW